VATLVTVGEQVSPKSDFLKRFLLTPTTQDQTPSDFDYAGLAVLPVFKISSKYVGITRSLATRRTLGMPKLLKCINKAQPERSRSHVIKNTAPELKSEPHFKKKHSSRAGAMLTKTESSEAGAISFLQEFRSPGSKWQLF